MLWYEKTQVAKSAENIIVDSESLRFILYNVKKIKFLKNSEYFRKYI